MHLYLYLALIFLLFPQIIAEEINSQPNDNNLSPMKQLI